MEPHMGRRPTGDAAMTNTERWRRWYAKQHPTKSNDNPSEEIARLQAENAALKAELNTARQTKSNDKPEGAVLNWIDQGCGFYQAETQVGTFFAAQDANASFLPKGKKKAHQLGEFTTLAEAIACCEENARGQKV
jgi:hypothetical protein